MSPQKVTCPPSVTVAVSVLGLAGVFLWVANLAEHPHGRRLGFEALLIIPLLFCSIVVAKVPRS